MNMSEMIQSLASMKFKLQRTDPEAFTFLTRFEVAARFLVPVPIELAFLRFFILRPALSYSSSSFVSSE
jgi:hypothetical protein